MTLLRQAEIRHARHFLGLLERARRISDLGDMRRAALSVEDDWQNVAQAIRSMTRLSRSDQQYAALLSRIVDVGTFFITLRMTPSEERELLGEASSAAELIADERALAAHLGNLALAHKSLGDYDEALRLQMRAMSLNERTGFVMGQAQCVGNMGNIALETGRYEDALGLYARQRELARSAGDFRGIGNSHMNAGLALRSLGRSDEALAEYDSAQSAFEQVGDALGSGRLMANKASLLRRLGRREEARELLQRRIASAEELGDEHGKALGIANLAILERDCGNFAEALDLLARAWERLSASGHRRIGLQVHAEMARCHTGLGDTRAARTDAAFAVELAREHGLPVDEDIRALAAGP
ncbi:tetratricopeptide repeat protein [Streptomyces shenzhenensis]|uniref:tetratricopeptide repeat protein n=1 Tax=Streptomyces shenzhenensis TaxID=943815 RepID=UPI0015F089E3|nr:tetratricopeptide repeat protein [Streptomyces shenzhenensis]